MRRGFNLVEAAIVLGVVGLIIGGIWVAAAAVQKNHKFNQLANGMLVINANIRRLYQGQDTNVYSRFDTGPDILPAVLAGADGYRQLPSINIDTYIMDPTQSRINVRLDNRHIVYDLHLANVDDCMKLLSRISAAGKSELSEANVGSTSYFTFPFIPTASDCAAGNYVNVWFNF